MEETRNVNVKNVKMTRLEITFMSGKFIAYPGVIKESINFQEGNTLAFKCAGTARTLSEVSEVLVVMSNVCFIESIDEEDCLVEVTD